MLDLPFLRTTIHEAVDGLVDRVVDLMPEPRALDETARVSSLGKQVLRVVGKNPGGMTANDLAEALDVGLAPMFEQLRDLMASNRLLRVVRGNDELPLYVLPKSS